MKRAPFDNKFTPNLDYVRENNRRGIRYASWTKPGYGRWVKGATGFMTDEANTGLLFDRGFKDIGSSPKPLFKTILNYFPDVEAWYSEQTDGGQLTPRILYSRCYMQTYRNEAPRPDRNNLSREFYKSSPDIRPILGLLTKWLVSNTIITRVMADEEEQKLAMRIEKEFL